MADDADAMLKRALRRAEAQFALAERSARIGAWRQDLETGDVTWSAGMYRMFGLDPSHKQARPIAKVRDYVRADDLVTLDQAIAKAIADRSSFSYRTRANDPRLPVQAIDTYGEVEFDDSGKAIALVGVSRDVTAQVVAESGRATAEEWYRAIADQASDIIILYEFNGRTLYVSDAVTRVLGRRPEELANLHHLDFVHPEDEAEARRLVTIPPAGTTLTATYRVRHHDGHYIWMEASARGVFDEHGRCVNIVGVSRDITERKRREAETARARDEAIAANIAKSTFLANMSHELRTPLNAIIGFAEIMRGQLFGPLGSEQYSDYARLIHESGQLLLDLISDVLDMAKIEAGKLEIHPEEVQLDQMVEDCVRLIEERARQSEITMSADLSDTLLHITADRRALKQILLNLLSNAVKFTLPGGCIIVRTADVSGGLALSVSDDGVGIPAEDLPRLGNPFEQARTDATVTGGGAGLGLALVRALAEKHGGHMTIESEEGFGTTVTVWLPRGADAEEAAA